MLNVHSYYITIIYGGATTALDMSGFGTFTSGGVLDQGDFANSNVIALIAGTVDTDTVVLGNTFLQMELLLGATLMQTYQLLERHTLWSILNNMLMLPILLLKEM